MKITVTDKVKGKIKPLHGVGQPPFAGLDFGMFHYLTEAGIPFARLHDLGVLMGGRFVDIPCIFRDFNADADDPASYDFAFTDKLLEALDKSGVETFYRLGVTIENYQYIKAYNIFPPKDNLQWAKICAGIIRHYNEGWANGYHFNIRYWEIWNEPENRCEPELNQMWTGTQQEYFDLYDVASKYLRKQFPDIKIGGYASCGFYRLYTGDDYQGTCPTNEDLDFYMSFFDDFLAFVKKNKCPFDFFSWHNYGGPEEIAICAEYVDKRLKEEGFENVEQTINEWHCMPDKRGTPKHAATVASAILKMQDTPLDSAMFYDARLGVSIYGGMFDPFTRKPFGTYYAFYGFNELFKREKQLEIKVEQQGIYAVAAKGKEDSCIMIANPTDKACKLELELGGKKVISCRKTDKNNHYVECELPKMLNKDTFIVVTFK